jgi:hypothetical protein
LWLDRGGWLGGDDVTDMSSNESCNLEKLQSIFTPDPSTISDPVQNWYYGEPMEIEEFQKFFVNLAAGPADAENLLRNQFGDVWVIWYYFLYPGHEEFLRRCEAFSNEKSDGDYEGDWNAVAVLVKRPSPLPWETPGQPVFPEPSHVGYGVRLRGLGKDVVSQDTFKQGMTIHKWTDIEKDSSSGFHPRVYVARGYHNNYATPGAHVPRDPTLLSINIGSIACGVGEGASAISDESRTLSRTPARP